ncbi:class I SAM-dependent methyltransferase [Arthrobacter sp. LS16]|uniref:class I SAM-dependent methyltransferase n=1 Tax=Arthrobacter sp. 'calajunan' TaxID=1690248 RepID=UPI003C71F8EC
MSEDEFETKNYIDLIETILHKTEMSERFNSGWGVRLRLATMEGAAESAAHHYLLSALTPIRYMPPVGGWSMQYQVIASLVDYILNTEIENPLIVELGSGVSTSWLALALEKIGKGRLISVDHDPRYKKITEYTLKKLGLCEYVDIVLAELTETSGLGNNQKWYDLNEINRYLSNEELIDLLVVDGPPGNEGPKSRFPAFPVLRRKLADNSMVVLDDTDRGEEQRIIDNWIEECSHSHKDGQLAMHESIGRSTWLKYSMHQT